MRTIIDMEHSKMSSITVESPEEHYVRMVLGNHCVIYLKTEDAYELCQCLKEVVDAE